ncbi:MAG TPA: LexA family transcriptional regulator [Gammaproteobacteria bacterium]|nr:LexA family transcriptional regulator [Gammaproteobacteria bacterium]
MENKNLSERLRFTLKFLGISQTELANKIRVKPQVIQYLCQGKAQKSKFTFEIAEALNIDVSWLATGKGVIPDLSSTKQNKRTIPILTFDQIKEKEIENKKIDISKSTQQLPISEEINLNSFGIILNDIAMAPRFELNTIVIIDPTIDIHKTQKNNRFVLVYLNNENFFVFRQLDIADNSKTLRAHNTNLYKDILLKDSDIILGVCKEARWST